MIGQHSEEIVIPEGACYESQKETPRCSPLTPFLILLFIPLGVSPFRRLTLIPQQDFSKSLALPGNGVRVSASEEQPRLKFLGQLGGDSSGSRVVGLEPGFLCGAGERLTPEKIGHWPGLGERFL